MRFWKIPVLAAALAAGPGCGSDSNQPATDASTTPTPTTSAGGAPPAELLGSYTVRLTKADTAGNKAPELQGQDQWKMKITKDGGVDNAPTLTIIRPPSDVLESSTLSVARNTLTLTGQECAQPSGGYKLVSSSYTWKLDGKTLRLTTAKPGCSDKVAETILTSEAWKQS